MFEYYRKMILMVLRCQEMPWAWGREAEPNPINYVTERKQFSDEVIYGLLEYKKDLERFKKGEWVKSHFIVWKIIEPVKEKEYEVEIKLSRKDGSVDLKILDSWSSFWASTIMEEVWASTNNFSISKAKIEYALQFYQNKIRKEDSFFFQKTFRYEEARIRLWVSSELNSLKWWLEGVEVPPEFLADKELVRRLEAAWILVNNKEGKATFKDPEALKKYERFIEISEDLHDEDNRWPNERIIDKQKIVDNFEYLSNPESNWLDWEEIIYEYAEVICEDIINEWYMVKRLEWWEENEKNGEEKKSKSGTFSIVKIPWETNIWNASIYNRIIEDERYKKHIEVAFISSMARKSTSFWEKDVISEMAFLTSILENNEITWKDWKIMKPQFMFLKDKNKDNPKRVLKQIWERRTTLPDWKASIQRRQELDFLEDYVKNERYKEQSNKTRFEEANRYKEMYLKKQILIDGYKNPANQDKIQGMMGIMNDVLNKNRWAIVLVAIFAWFLWKKDWALWLALAWAFWPAVMEAVDKSYQLFTWEESPLIWEQEFLEPWDVVPFLSNSEEYQKSFSIIAKKNQDNIESGGYNKEWNPVASMDPEVLYNMTEDITSENNREYFVDIQVINNPDLEKNLLNNLNIVSVNSETKYTKEDVKTYIELLKTSWVKWTWDETVLDYLTAGWQDVMNEAYETSKFTWESEFDSKINKILSEKYDGADWDTREWRNKINKAKEAIVNTLTGAEGTEADDSTWTKVSNTATDFAKWVKTGLAWVSDLDNKMITLESELKKLDFGDENIEKILDVLKDYKLYKDISDKVDKFTWAYDRVWGKLIRKWGNVVSDNIKADNLTEVRGKISKLKGYKSEIETKKEKEPFTSLYEEIEELLTDLEKEEKQIDKALFEWSEVQMPDENQVISRFTTDENSVLDLFVEIKGIHKVDFKEKIEGIENLNYEDLWKLLVALKPTIDALDSYNDIIESYTSSIDVDDYLDTKVEVRNTQGKIISKLKTYDKEKWELKQKVEEMLWKHFGENEEQIKSLEGINTHANPQETLQKARTYLEKKGMQVNPRIKKQLGNLRTRLEKLEEEIKDDNSVDPNVKTSVSSALNRIPPAWSWFKVATYGYANYILWGVWDFLKPVWSFFGGIATTIAWWAKATYNGISKELESINNWLKKNLSEAIKNDDSTIKALKEARKVFSDSVLMEWKENFSLKSLDDLYSKKFKLVMASVSLKVSWYSPIWIINVADLRAKKLELEQIKQGGVTHEIEQEIKEKIEAFEKAINNDIIKSIDDTQVDSFSDPDALLNEKTKLEALKKRHTWDADIEKKVDEKIKEIYKRIVAIETDYIDNVFTVTIWDLPQLDAQEKDLKGRITKYSSDEYKKYSRALINRIRSRIGEIEEERKKIFMQEFESVSIPSLDTHQKLKDEISRMYTCMSEHPKVITQVEFDDRELLIIDKFAEITPTESSTIDILDKHTTTLSQLATLNPTNTNLKSDYELLKSVVRVSPQQVEINWTAELLTSVTINELGVYLDANLKTNNKQDLIKDLIENTKELFNK